MIQETTDSITTSVTDTLDWAAVDTIAVHVEEPPTVSLFTEHLLQTKPDMVPQEIASMENGFAFLIFGFCAALIIYVHRNSDGIFKSVFKGSFDRYLALQESRVENSQRTRNLLLLQVISAISISIFLSGVVLLMVRPDVALTLLFFQILFALISFILMKKGVQWLLASLFQLKPALKAYHFNINILFSLGGMIVLPLSLLLYFSPIIPTTTLVYSSGAVLAFLYLKALQRGSQIALGTNSISILHLFYYFCALEILPVFVLIRIIQDL